MNQQLRRKLDHITNVLWAGGVTNPVTYIEQISYLIFLKRAVPDRENSRRLEIGPSGLETNLGGAPDPGLRPGLSEIGPSGLNRKRGQSKTKQSLRGTAWFHG